MGCVNRFFGFLSLLLLVAFGWVASSIFDFPNHDRKAAKNYVSYLIDPANSSDQYVRFSGFLDGSAWSRFHASRETLAILTAKYDLIPASDRHIHSLPHAYYYWWKPNTRHAQYFVSRTDRPRRYEVSYDQDVGIYHVLCR